MPDNKKKSKKTEEVFTPQDSAMFKAYEKYMEDHIEADTTMFNPAFMDKYNIYSQKPDEEVRAEIQKQIKGMPGQEKMVLDYYQKNPSAVASLRGNIYEEKIINSIMSKSKTTKKKVGKIEAEKLIKEQNEKDLKQVKEASSKKEDVKTKKVDISKKSTPIKKKTTKKVSKK